MWLFDSSLIPINPDQSSSIAHCPPIIPQSYSHPPSPHAARMVPPPSPQGGPWGIPKKGSIGLLRGPFSVLSRNSYDPTGDLRGDTRGIPLEILGDPQGASCRFWLMLWDDLGKYLLHLADDVPEAVPGHLRLLGSPSKVRHVRLT